MKNNNIQKDRGFTLVEMLTSVAIFSIVLVVIMGSIITVIDVNRKAQSLTIVMNDLNFVLESMTRTIKTGEVIADGPSFITIENQDDEEITYTFSDGAIFRSVDDGDDISVTSSQIDIQEAEFNVFDGPNQQPRVLILVAGEVQTSPDISSAFKIQTTVSQRNLDID